MKIPHNGTLYDFPDDATFDEMKDFFGSKDSSGNESLQSGKKEKSEAVKNLENMYVLNRTPSDTVRDIAAGGLRAGQNIAALMGEAGQAIGSFANPLQKYIPESMKFAPDVNIREELGLGKKNPLDVRNLVQGNNPNPFLQGIAQYAPGAIAGGASLPGQIISNSLYAGTQAQPDERNMFGILPEGRPGAMIEGGTLAALPFFIKPIMNAFKNTFIPSKTYNELIKSTGGGKNITENIEELGKRIQYGSKATKEEALIPKKEIMLAEGESPIVPTQIKGKQLSYDVSNIFSSNRHRFSNEETKSINKAIKQYYDDGDFDKLIESGEEIFSHPGLSAKEVTTLDAMLTPEKKITGSYLKLKDIDQNYSDILKEAHNDYVKNSTFRNSDRLRSRLFKRINELSSRMKSKTITDSGEKELNSLIKARKAIIEDQDKFISTLSPEMQGKYGKYNKLWREDVRAYEDANITIKNIKNDHMKNVTPDKITQAFSFPELNPQLQKVLKDIGPQGVDNLIFNELGRTSNAKDALKLLDDLTNARGFNQYITPQTKNQIELMRRQLRNKRSLLWGGGAAASSVGAGALYELGRHITNKGL